MKNDEAKVAGMTNLSSAWEEAQHVASVDLPDEILRRIAELMNPDINRSPSYALVTQSLLRIVLGDDLDSPLRVKNFTSVSGGFSARSFARSLMNDVPAVRARIGNTDDLYASFPLRPSGDEIVKTDDEWEHLRPVLQYGFDNAASRNVLVAALRHLKNRPELPRKSQTTKKPEAVPADLTAIAENLSISEDFLAEILEVLKSDQPQVILAGPPGTSKTEVALGLASILTGGERSQVRVVQFHASYGYEDFVEGLRPSPDTGGGLTFSVIPGAVRTSAEESLDGEQRVIVMDEMNRANLPRVLGEMLFALERRREPIDLLYTREFELPGNIAFIGTMNTADKSIRKIDAAVRRRFQIFEFPPQPGVVEQHYQSRPNSVDDLVPGMEALNALLTAELGRHHTIGHTYFLRDEMDETTLHNIWDRQIGPLLEEYFFDQEDLLDELTVARFWPSLSDQA